MSATYSKLKNFVDFLLNFLSKLANKSYVIYQTMSCVFVGDDEKSHEVGRIQSYIAKMNVETNEVVDFLSHLQKSCCSE